MGGATGKMALRGELLGAEDFRSRPCPEKGDKGRFYTEATALPATCGLCA